MKTIQQKTTQTIIGLTSMKVPSLSLISRFVSFAAVVSASLALATPAFAGVLTVTSGPTLTPSTAFQNSTLTIQTLNNASLVRESGNVTATVPQDPTTSISIAFTGNYSANAGDVASVAYSFTVDSNDPRVIFYDVIGSATINGVTQRFDSQGLITQGVLQYTANATAAAPFPVATTGTFSGTLKLQATIQLPSSSGADASAAVTPSAASGTLDISITHGDFQLTGGAPTPTPTPSQLQNISSRTMVMGGDQDAIAGFIISGTAAKKVIVRGIGPSLPNYVPTRLGDPKLDLVQLSDGTVLATNNDWKDTQQVEILATGLAPTNDLESAIVATLNPGNYTAQLSGNGATAASNGIGLIEVYDLSPASDSAMANLSTRSLVQTGDNVLIGGIIVGGGTATSNIVVRALGPSLSQMVAGTLVDPNLSLHDGNGTMIAFNEDWQQDANASQVSASGLAPASPKESALYRTLAPGQYTAIVRGNAGGTGIGVVEFYRVQPSG